MIDKCEVEVKERRERGCNDFPWFDVLFGLCCLLWMYLYIRPVRMSYFASNSLPENLSL
jgi:hypothetical protein